MTTPDDAKNGMRAVLNQIPATMTATHAILGELIDTPSVVGEDGQVSSDRLNESVNWLKACLLATVVELENRIEKLEGRPGIPTGMLGQVLSEFRSTG